MGPHTAAVAADDATDCGEANPRSWEIGLRVETVERDEKLVGVGHVEANAVVSDEVGVLSAHFLPAELDAGGRMSRRELERIREQVLEHDAEKPRVAETRDSVLDHELDLAIRL